ncbi:cupin domain-containing protein [uncultured Oscillibacter sp.]|uniref:cupin domain-containing protein n=1 Tax=uncultured Oscillibacter sp. TaxID=876091 RepID=UPI0025EB5AB4|nr:cupin domain-containing protein [uncultured Oscillibacter sp.]
MEKENTFERFDRGGRLVLAGGEIPFADIPWSKHPAFEGVELKAIVTSEQTAGEASFHLVRIAPDRAIGEHIHEAQTETHEVIAGKGVCVCEGAELPYEPGAVAVMPKGAPHEVRAGGEGLYLFAKFFPALI